VVETISGSLRKWYLLMLIIACQDMIINAKISYWVTMISYQSRKSMITVSAK
jgi:hypothetical protein